MKTTLIVLALVALLAEGCAAFGPNPSPPTKFEQTIYDVKTNVVQQVVIRTNFVTQIVPVAVFQTNSVGVLLTNYVTVSQVVPQYVTITNTTETYLLTPKASTVADTQVAGSVSNLMVPGSGGLVAGILAGLFTMWGKLRSSKQTGSALAQNIETMREFLKTLPNGSKYDLVLTTFMQAHQAEAGVLNQVLDILNNTVSNAQAQGSVKEIQNALADLSKPSQ